MRKLLSDPPLLNRLLWRDPMRRETLVSHDPALMARAYGTLFLAGGVFGSAILAFGEDVGRENTTFAILVSVSFVIGAAVMVGYQRLPRWSYQLLTLAGTAIITAVVASASPGAEGGYALIYIWIPLLAGLFFTVRVAAAHIALVVAAFALVLATHGSEYVVNYVLIATGVLFISGWIIAALRARIEQLAADLASEANTDKLTGLANRRGFDERFALEVARSTRSGRPLSLMVCDLDHFKNVNDTLGHEQGDITLRRVARVINASVRVIDSVARPGGEEFTVLLPETGASRALEVAERVRVGVCEEFNGGEVSLTISCGVATADSEVDTLGPGQLFSHADGALYRAKRAGRNRSISYDGSDGDEEASSTK